MGRVSTAGLAALMLTVLAACGPSPGEPASQPAGAQEAARLATGAGPAAKPGGGLIAEKSGVEGNLYIKIRWSAQTVKGIPEEGQITEVYNRTTDMTCPVTSNGAAPFSYFTLIDKPDSSEPFAATGSYQQWFNEECSGTITIKDSYHFNDPTIAGPEPVVLTSGTRPFRLGDIPPTIETDLNRGRTRYMFISPSAEGFQQDAAPGYPAKLTGASAAPQATMDFTLEGPIGDGRGEIAVEGGILSVDWTFTRGRHRAQ